MYIRTLYMKLQMCSSHPFLKLQRIKRGREDCLLKVTPYCFRVWIVETGLACLM